MSGILKTDTTVIRIRINLQCVKMAVNDPIMLSDSIDDGSNPLSTPFITMLSTNAVLHFLDENIPEDADLIISTVRKGSWIIEDFLHRTGRCIRNITHNERFPEDRKYSNVILFDDSVHTGNTILEMYRVVPEGCRIRVCCIAINEDALKRLRAEGIEEIYYLELFEKYEEYRNDSKGEMELLDGCQSYYYSHFIIPYLSGLTFNYSPDYISILIRIRSDTSDDLDKVTDEILKSISDRITNSVVLYRDSRILRLSAELSSDFTTGVLRELCELPFEEDMGKIRISAVVWEKYTDVVITPIVSYVIETDDDIRNILTECSEKILSILHKTIEDAIENSGFEIIKTYKFQADKGIGWECE